MSKRQNRETKAEDSCLTLTMHIVEKRARPKVAALREANISNNDMVYSLYIHNWN